MAQIIYTANLSSQWKLIFDKLYEDNKEDIDKAERVTNDDGIEFIPLTLKVGNGDSWSPGRTIYLHLREKKKKHYMITTEQYETYKSQIDVADVVIFINDEDNAVNELDLLKEYLHID